MLARILMLMARSSQAAWSPSVLFAAGEQGAWYEPSLTNGTLFQDSAGATPVTAVGQPVGLMLDKSGRGNHVQQPTAINRPVLQIDSGGRYFLAFKGTNQWLENPGTALSLISRSLFIVCGGIISGADGTIVSRSLSAAGSDRYAVVRSGNTEGLYMQAGVSASVTVSSASTARQIMMAQYSLSNYVAQYQVNNSSAATISAAPGGSYVDRQLLVGAYTNASGTGKMLFLNGAIYGIVLRLAQPSAEQVQAAKTYMNSKTGAY